MLMKEELAQLVIEGKKTQTRRPSKPGETLAEINGLKTVLDARGHIKYQVGREYALQYGRGLPTRYWNQTEGIMSWDFYRAWLAKEGQKFHEIAKLMGWQPLKYKLLDVWHENVRTISYEDSLEEGFDSAIPFFRTWVGFYDNPALSAVDVYKHHSDFKIVLSLLNARPAELYQAWALKFEVVKP
jgi:hypothetical protein